MEGGEREKGGTRTITDGKHSNLNIGTESRVQIADALGKELHHPILSKLWNSETGHTDRQTARETGPRPTEQMISWDLRQYLRCVKKDFYWLTPGVAAKPSTSPM